MTHESRDRAAARARALYTSALLALALGVRAWLVAPTLRAPAPPPRCARVVQVGPPDGPLRCLPRAGLGSLARKGLSPRCLAHLARAGLADGDRLVPDPRHPGGCRVGRMPPTLIRALGLRVPVNRASAAELATLPGVGPALARRLLEARARGGPFRRPEDLTRVKGIGPRLAARLAPRLSF